jgi:hypothetical protein
MPTRRWMLALGVSSAATLAVGLPVMAVTTSKPYRVVHGEVVLVDPRSRTVRLSTGGAATGRHSVTVTVPAGLRVGMPTGSEQLDQLTAGQRVSVDLSTGADHVARWISLDS